MVTFILVLFSRTTTRNLWTGAAARSRPVAASLPMGEQRPSVQSTEHRVRVPSPGAVQEPAAGLCEQQEQG